MTTVTSDLTLSTEEVRAVLDSMDSNDHCTWDYHMEIKAVREKIEAFAGDGGLVLRRVEGETTPAAEEADSGKPAEAAALTSEERALIHAALRALPTECLYHGENTEPRDHLFGREACCDTGIPARRRKLAEQALLTHIARSSS